MEAPASSEKKPRDDNSWWLWLTTLFASDTSGRPADTRGGDAGSMITPDTGHAAHHDGADSADCGGGDAGGGDGGGGGGD